MNFLVRRYGSDLYNEPDSYGEALLLAGSQPECVECGRPTVLLTERALFIYPSLNLGSQDVYFASTCMECAPTMAARLSEPVAA